MATGFRSGFFDGTLLDRQHRRWVLGSFGLHALVLALFALAPPNERALGMGLDLDDTRARLLRVELAALAHEPPPPVPADGAAAGPPGPAAAEAEARGPEATRPGREGARGRRVATAGPLTRDDVVSVGVLGALAARRDHLGALGTSAFGAVLAEARGPGTGDDGDGPGGSALERGLGPGRAGCPPGVPCSAALSRLDRLGPSGGGPGGPDALGDGRRAARIPPPPRGAVTTVGAVSQEDVRRVVRRNHAQVRFCYERALQARPDLEGRLTVHFVVDAGRVTTVAAVDNELHPDVGACLRDKIRTWSFPVAPGVTAITYPFLFYPR